MRSSNPVLRSVVRFSSGFVCSLLILLGVVTATTGYAMNRPLPVDAKFGLFSPSNGPNIVIDGKKYLLTAGAQIRDGKNRIILPQSLNGPDVSILYKKNDRQKIDRIWILTKEEVDRYSPDVTPPAIVPNRTARPSNGPIQIR